MTTETITLIITTILAIFVLIKLGFKFRITSGDFSMKEIKKALITGLTAIPIWILYGKYIPTIMPTTIKNQLLIKIFIIVTIATLIRNTIKD